VGSIYSYICKLVKIAGKIVYFTLMYYIMQQNIRMIDSPRITTGAQIKVRMSGHNEIYSHFQPSLAVDSELEFRSHNRKSKMMVSCWKPSLHNINNWSPLQDAIQYIIPICRFGQISKTRRSKILYSETADQGASICLCSFQKYS